MTRSNCWSPSALGGGVKVLFENELGAADFHLPNKSCILYVSECDVIAGNGYKRKLVRYRNVSLMKVVTDKVSLCETFRFKLLSLMSWRPAAASSSWFWWRKQRWVSSTSQQCRRLWCLTSAWLCCRSADRLRPHSSSLKLWVWTYCSCWIVGVEKWLVHVQWTQSPAGAYT